jgi:dTDP-4-dehydrorhamnose reductase
MRVYVTGGTGFVGSNVVKLCTEVHGLDVTIAARRSAELPLPGRFVPVDLLDRDAVRASIREAAPDLVVHTAILNDFDSLYADRRLGWDSYVEATRAVVDAANAVDAAVLYVSSDWVFDGTAADSDEQTPPNPVNYYGFLKAAAELVTLERAKHPIVARVAGVNGVHWAQQQGPRTQDAGFGFFVASLVDALSAGTPFTVWEADAINMRATPSLASESAEMMLRLAQAGARGIFHCCGGESLSRMELALTAADVFGLEASLISAGPPDAGGMMTAPVPHDTTLAAKSTAATIDYTLPTVRQLLGEFRRQRETGHIGTVAT